MSEPLPEYRPMTWLHVHLWRPIVVGFLKLVMFLLGPIQVKGRYRVPKQGGLLVLPNHLSDSDPVTVQCACPRPIRFMAKSELFEMKVLGPFMRWAHVFPVKRGEPDRGALRYAAAMLKEGECVCVFPEGQLAEDGELQPLKPGVALIVRMARVPVICCGIQGTNRIIPYGQVVPRPAFGGVEVAWGEPRQFDKDASAEDILAWVEAQLRQLGAQ